VSTNFQIGQKVECLCDDWQAKRFMQAWPVAGKIYVVRGFYDVGHRLGLYLHGVHNEPRPWIDGFAEAAFATINPDGQLNFRPVIERKTETDITELKKLLAPSPRKLEEVS
jgi:hypothetical protein